VLTALTHKVTPHHASPEARARTLVLGHVVAQFQRTFFGYLNRNRQPLVDPVVRDIGASAWVCGEAERGE
jgi:hypothetical protein